MHEQAHDEHKPINPGISQEEATALGKKILARELPASHGEQRGALHFDLSKPESLAKKTKR